MNYVNFLAFFGGLVTIVFLLGFFFFYVSGINAVSEIVALAAQAVNICDLVLFIHYYR